MSIPSVTPAGRSHYPISYFSRYPVDDIVEMPETDVYIMPPLAFRLTSILLWLPWVLDTRTSRFSPKPRIWLASWFWISACALFTQNTLSW